MCLTSSLTTIAHWIFAIAYFELALKCDLLIGKFESNKIRSQLKRKDQQILLANRLFYAFMAALMSLWLILPRLIQTWYTLELAGMLAAAIILVLSLNRLKKQISLLGQT